MTSEQERLSHDVPYFADLARSDVTILGAAANATDLATHGYLIVVNDLFWQIQQYCAGVSALLPHDIQPALHTVLRGLYEAAATLQFLEKQPNKEREAGILLAYSYLLDLKELPHDPVATRERQVILGRMPPDVVDEARKRSARHPRTWSGRKQTELLRESMIGGVPELYGPLSGSAHASRAGRYYRLELMQGDEIRIHTGRSIPHDERELCANFARRLLHGAFKIMWRANGGAPTRLETSDPEEWLHLNQ